MSQVTIYLAADVESRARREAKRRKKSLSAYVASVLAAPSRRERLAKLYGSCPDLKAPDDRDLGELRELILDR